MFFSSDVGFLMSACSVRLMWPSLWWSRCVFGAITPSFLWPDWAVVPPAVGAHGHVMQQTIKFLFTNRYSQFLLQKIQQSAGYKHNKKIYKMFNKTIWILTFFFLGIFFSNVNLTFTNISLSQLVENLILYKFAFYISSLPLILI